MRSEYDINPTATRRVVSEVANWFFRVHARPHDIVANFTTLAVQTYNSSYLLFVLVVHDKAA